MNYNSCWPLPGFAYSLIFSTGLGDICQRHSTNALESHSAALINSKWPRSYRNIVWCRLIVRSASSPILVLFCCFTFFRRICHCVSQGFAFSKHKLGLTQSSHHHSTTPLVCHCWLDINPMLTYLCVIRDSHVANDTGAKEFSWLFGSIRLIFVRRMSGVLNADFLILTSSWGCANVSRFLMCYPCTLLIALAILDSVQNAHIS
jgi:hypothetical protein